MMVVLGFVAALVYFCAVSWVVKGVYPGVWKNNDEFGIVCAAYTMLVLSSPAWIGAMMLAAPFLIT